MRRLLPVALLALGALTAPALALPSAQPLPTPGFASDNVEWLGNMPLHADTAGAHLLDGYMYITSSSQLSIYDVRTPESPQLLSTVPSPQEPYFAEEDVDTNGEILLISALGELRVFDVRDKANPVRLSTLAGHDEHTITCVLECTWAYGSGGLIVDLRDPAKPKKAGDWRTAVQGGPGTQHDVTEVASGYVLTSSRRMTLLDVRSDPSNPQQIAQATTADNRFIHANLWPREMEDRLLLVGGETSSSTVDCSDPRSGAFMTWDTTDWEKTKTFTMLDEYRPADNEVTDGDAVVQTYCSHWFTPRPGWADGGQLAVGWYEHGTRFLEIDPEGQIEEIGFFTPVGATSSAAYWASDDILYVLDYSRGLDVLRFHDEPLERPVPPVPAGLLAGGLSPDQAPLKPRRLLPGMLDGDTWRC